MGGKCPPPYNPKDAKTMGKKGKVRLNWPDRIKQPRMPVRKTQHTPFDEVVFGPSISSEELYARVCMRKAY
jgi:hypothetical protein